MTSSCWLLAFRRCLTDCKGLTDMSLTALAKYQRILAPEAEHDDDHTAGLLTTPEARYSGNTLHDALIAAATGSATRSARTNQRDNGTSNSAYGNAAGVARGSRSASARARAAHVLGFSVGVGAPSAVCGEELPSDLGFEDDDYVGGSSDEDEDFRVACILSKSLQPEESTATAGHEAHASLAAMTSSLSRDPSFRANNGRVGQSADDAEPSLCFRASMDDDDASAVSGDEQDKDEGCDTSDSEGVAFIVGEAGQDSSIGALTGMAAGMRRSHEGAPAAGAGVSVLSSQLAQLHMQPVTATADNSMPAAAGTTADAAGPGPPAVAPLSAAGLSKRPPHPPMQAKQQPGLSSTGTGASGAHATHMPNASASLSVSHSLVHSVGSAGSGSFLRPGSPVAGSGVWLASPPLGSSPVNSRCGSQPARPALSSSPAAAAAAPASTRPQHTHPMAVYGSSPTGLGGSHGSLGQRGTHGAGRWLAASPLGTSPPVHAASALAMYGSSPVMAASPYFRASAGSAAATPNQWLVRAASSAASEKHGRGLMSISLAGTCCGGWTSQSLACGHDAS